MEVRFGERRAAAAAAADELLSRGAINSQEDAGPAVEYSFFTDPDSSIAGCPIACFRTSAKSPRVSSRVTELWYDNR